MTDVQNVSEQDADESKFEEVLTQEDASFDPLDVYYLRSRGIDESYAAWEGLRSLPDTVSKGALTPYGIGKVPCGGVLITYRQSTAKGTYRLRLRQTEFYNTEFEGSNLFETKTTFPKFYASKGKEVVPYFPRALTQAVLKDATVPLFIAEGPIKAISLCAAGFLCIGLGGVEAGFHDVAEAHDTGHLVLHDNLKCVEWRGRTVYVVSDAGRQSNASVARGEAKLAKILREAGANVMLVQLPWAQKDPRPDVVFDPADQGPDDYVARDGREAFAELVEQAMPGSPIEWALRCSTATDVEKLLSWLPFQAALAVGGARAQDGVLAGWKKFKTSKRSIKESVSEYEVRVHAKGKKNLPAWNETLIRNKDGVVTATLANVLHIIRNDERLKGRLVYNEFSCVLLWKEPPPWKTRESAVTDPDATGLAEYLQREWDLVVKTSMCIEAIVKVADENAYHPVREYLNNLRWDGVPRLGSWLTVYLGADHSDYATATGKKWCIGAVARIMQPGCKMDTTLVLEGPQGKQKSTALNTLAGEEHFLDDLRDIGSKDACDQIAGHWIVELGELAAMSRADLEEVKRFLTTRKDTFRPAYGRFKRTYYRQCVFSGSTNQDEYLRDDTGNRRFWPIKVNSIDIEGLKRDRDQIWAEAVHLFRNGEKWWFTEEESDILTMAEDEQESRRQQHPWEELFRRELVGRCLTSVNDVLADVLHIPSEKWATCATQAGKSLKAAGWYRTQRPRPSREWVYLRNSYKFGADGCVVGPDGLPASEQPPMARIRSEPGMCVDDPEFEEFLEKAFSTTPVPSALESAVALH